MSSCDLRRDGVIIDLVCNVIRYLPYFGLCRNLNELYAMILKARINPRRIAKFSPKVFWISKCLRISCPVMIVVALFRHGE